MTRGGPEKATSLLLFYIYEVGFRFLDTSYAAALTVVLLAILASLALGQFVSQQHTAADLQGILDGLEPRRQRLPFWVSEI